MERYAKEAPLLALIASRRALDESGVKAEQITHLVTVSCTGFQAPGFDIELIKKLGLSFTTHRAHVGFMGCHGALNGLKLAKALADASSSACVLVCAVELCSLHFQYGWDTQKVVANSLFADGAAACVVASPPKMAKESWRIAASGAGIFPDSEEAMTWKIGNHGFEMTLSNRVPDLIASHLPLWCENWLAENKLKSSDIHSWAIHPGGPRILEAVAACLNLSQDTIRASRDVLTACGNMSSPTILFILRNLMLEKAPRPCVALGFGPGLSVEAALFI
jgi:predicted naringenin-chalcone synthase